MNSKEKEITAIVNTINEESDKLNEIILERLEKIDKNIKDLKLLYLGYDDKDLK